MPDYYNEHRSKKADTFIGLGKNRVDVGDAAVVSLFQSFQVNLEAKSLADACDKLNRSLFIAPYLLALSANARFLGCVDTGFQDLRMISWERSHDTGVANCRMLAWEKSFDLRTKQEIDNGQGLRVGLPERYFVDVADYFRRMEQFPFILHSPEAALRIAIGMTWLDARVKLIDDSAVVELRLLSAQPTIEQEILLALLYIGRLVYSQENNEPFLPINYVRENRLLAMLYSSCRAMWFFDNEGMVKKMPCSLGLEIEAHRARQGLEILGLANFLDTELLRLQLEQGCPSDFLAKALYRKGHSISYDAMIQSLQETNMLI